MLWQVKCIVVKKMIFKQSGVIKYPVTEKVDGRFVVNEKVKEGPTGLITSTTRAKLHPENETRILSIHITDTRDHIKAIMKAQANDNRREMDTEPWKAYGTWLAGQDNRVSIPYSEALADLIPVYDVRQNRDITVLLNTIKTLAIMHQARRKRDAQGRIIATMQDYSMARDLLNDLLSQGIGATVSKAVRETVAAVKALAPDGKTTNSKAVAAQLNVGKGAASNRISNALSEGYIVNLQEPGKRGHKLALGSPLPEDTLLLPEPHELLNAATCNIVQQFTSIWGCTKAIENLPSIVHLIVHPETRTNATVSVFDKPYDLRQHTKSPYVGHGEPDQGDENPEPSSGRLTPPKQGELLNYVTKSPEPVTSGDGSEGDERTKGELKSVPQAEPTSQQTREALAQEQISADPEDWGVYEVVRHAYSVDHDFYTSLPDAQLWSNLVQCGLIPSGTPVSDVADARARALERAA